MINCRSFQVYFMSCDFEIISLETLLVKFNVILIKFNVLRKRRRKFILEARRCSLLYQREDLAEIVEIACRLCRDQI